MGTRSLPGATWPGHGIDHPPPSSAKVKERVQLLWAFVACSTVNFTFTKQTLVVVIIVIIIFFLLFFYHYSILPLLGMLL
jgi:hypothetical protein